MKVLSLLKYSTLALLTLSGCGKIINSSSQDRALYNPSQSSGSTEFIAATTIITSKCASCHAAFSSYSEADFIAHGLVVARSAPPARPRLGDAAQGVSLAKADVPNGSDSSGGGVHRDAPSDACAAEDVSGLRTRSSWNRIPARRPRISMQLPTVRDHSTNAVHATRARGIRHRQ